MRSISDGELLALLAEALDPGRALRVQEALQASPDLRARLSLLAAAVRDDAPAPRWPIPAPGAGFAARAEADALTMGRPLRPGGTFSVRLPPVADAADRLVVVFRRLGDRWIPVAPTAADDAFPLAALDPDGEDRLLVLEAADDEGMQGWAVALPRAEGQDWALPATWDELREAMAFGEVPVAAVEIVVKR